MELAEAKGTMLANGDRYAEKNIWGNGGLSGHFPTHGTNPGSPSNVLTTRPFACLKKIMHERKNGDLIRKPRPFYWTGEGVRSKYKRKILNSQHHIGMHRLLVNKTCKGSQSGFLFSFEPTKNLHYYDF